MKRSWLIGSANDCDLIVDHPDVADHHCRLSLGDSGYALIGLDTKYGTYVNGIRLDREGEVRVSPSDEVILGQSVRMPWPTETLGIPQELRLGRDLENGLVIDLPMISGRHARVGWDGSPGRAWIEDLGSSNGTSVGRSGRVSGRGVFGAADLVYLGSQAFSGAWLLARLGVLPSEQLAFHGDAMTLGRDPECEAVVEATQVSWRHARVTRDESGLWIEDLGSSNGTFVNGRPVVGRTAIVDGDLVGLGSHTLVLRSGPDTPGASESGHAAEVSSVALASGVPLVGLNLSEASGEAVSGGRRAGWFVVLLGQSVVLGLAIAAVGRMSDPKGAESRVASVDSWLALTAVWFGLRVYPVIFSGISRYLNGGCLKGSGFNLSSI